MFEYFHFFRKFYSRNLYRKIPKKQTMARFQKFGVFLLKDNGLLKWGITKAFEILLLEQFEILLGQCWIILMDLLILENKIYALIRWFWSRLYFCKGNIWFGGGFKSKVLKYFCPSFSSQWHWHPPALLSPTLQTMIQMQSPKISCFNFLMFAVG